MTLSRWVKTALLAGGASLVLGGCTVSAATPPLRVAYQVETQPVYTAGPVYPEPVYQTQPVYFDGLLVHFDSVGPYIFVGRSPRYIPRNHPRYTEVVRHDPRRRYEPRGGRYAERDGRYDGRYDNRDRGRHDGRNDRRGPRHY